MRSFLSYFLCLAFLISCVAQHPVEYSPDAHVKAVNLLDRATIFLRKGKLREARAGYEVALSVMELPAGYDGLGAVAFRSGDYSEAARYFWKAYELDSEYGHALANLALLYEVTGNRQRAKELYEQAIKENPSYAPVRNNYAVFLASDSASGGVNFSYLEEAQAEIQRAHMLAQHTIIEDNLKQLSKSSLATQ